MSIIIGDIHKFNGHCLIPLDPWKLSQKMPLSTLNTIQDSNGSLQKDVKDQHLELQSSFATKKTRMAPTISSEAQENRWEYVKVESKFCLLK